MGKTAIQDQAAAIALQAEAIAAGTLVGPMRPAVLRMARNVETLLAWVEQDEVLDSLGAGRGQT